MVEQDALRLIWDLLRAMVRDDLAAFDGAGIRWRASVIDVRSAIREYGRTLVDPPPGWEDEVDAHELTDGSGVAYDVPLWSREEGKSDLTLKVTVRGDVVQVDDLRVL